MKLSVVNQKGGRELAAAEGTNRVHLVYAPAYCKGDQIRLETGKPSFCRIRLEDTLSPTLVWLPDGTGVFPIPFGVDRAGFSPRSFAGKRHFIEAEAVQAEELSSRRDLALNPHDQTDNQGMYPHMTINVTYADSLRNKIFPDRGLFAPRNVIDGVLANESHRLYPHQSWGINRNPEAWLKCDFGRPVDIDTVCVAIRGEFPHDNYWVRATIGFSDGSEQEISLQKTLELQLFPMERKGITSLAFSKLVMSDEPSPFPALSLLRVYGTESER